MWVLDNCLGFFSVSGVIAISWIMNCKISMVRKQLKETRKQQLARFRIRAKVSSFELIAEENSV